MKASYLLLVFSFVSFFAMGQESVLKGKITDKNANPLPYASIQLQGTVRGVQSNAEGNFIMSNIPSGSYTVTVMNLGYEDMSQAVVLSPGQTTEIEIILNEEPIWIDSFELLSSRGILGQEKLPEVEDFRINAGKKNEVIRVRDLDANLAMNNSRQIFGRTPGISIWENDGSGIQLGVASRGLSPNRSWEFNVRMNGYDITPDPMGYPEAYFTPPMEVVEKIEVIRGASSLQFGPQFGGLLNFVLRRPDQSTRFTAETLT